MAGSPVASIGSGLTRAGHDLSQWVTSAWQSLSGGIRPAEVAALVVAAVALTTYAAIHVVAGPNRRLPEVLRPYQIGEQPPAAPDRAPARLVTIPWLRRMGEALARLAERRGLRNSLHVRLQQAGMATTVGEFLVTVVIGGLLLVALGGVLAGPLGALLALVVVGLAPPAALQALADRRRRRIEHQLTDVLKLLAASLRAGFSLLQGLGALVGRLPEPLGSEIQQAFAATRVGVPVEEALGAAADRSGSRDFTWVVTAIRIQREVGGNLAEILDTVAETMKERDRLHREVRTLTAEGRISAIVLGAMPFGVGVLVWLANRSYLDVLFNTLGGSIALLGGVALEVVGCLWLYRTVQIEV